MSDKQEYTVFLLWTIYCTFLYKRFSEARRQLTVLYTFRLHDWESWSKIHCYSYKALSVKLDMHSFLYLFEQYCRKTRFPITFILAFTWNHNLAGNSHLRITRLCDLPQGYQASSDLVNQFTFQALFLVKLLLLTVARHERCFCVVEWEIINPLLFLAELVWVSVSVTASPTHFHSQPSLWSTVTPACLPRHSGKW